jgi:ABC-2 type transport system permease protein
MKTIACFIKTFRENIRDWKILILTFVFAPFFIYMMYLYLGDTGSMRYNIVIVNNDVNGQLAGELIAEWSSLKSENGESVLDISIREDTIPAQEMIKNRDADLFITIPEGFSSGFEQFISGRTKFLPSIESYGDRSNVRFMIAASLADYVVFNFIGTITGTELPVNIKYKYAGRSKQISEFDLYVPAMLVLSIIMILFTAGASIVREIEKDTITRLSLSNLKSPGFMTALSLNQVIIGLICMLLTFLAAVSVGYRTSGSLSLLILIGALTCFSVIAISIITSCFIKTMFGLLTLGCFPFFILMFFSDCFMPLPKIDIMQIAGHQIYLNDILPTATATRAMNKILNFNSGFNEIRFEILLILLLSLVYYTIGILLFKRKYRY